MVGSAFSIYPNDTILFQPPAEPAATPKSKKGKKKGKKKEKTATPAVPVKGKTDTPAPPALKKPSLDTSPIDLDELIAEACEGTATLALLGWPRRPTSHCRSFLCVEF